MTTTTTWDGVRLLTAPTTGQARGGIVFRVGFNDESFACRGVTHLIEHLALFRLGLTDFHYNGTTASTVTHFFSQGTPEEVIAYIVGVCEALGDLPLDRLDTEKHVLDTEAHGRTQSMGSLMNVWRYGAAGAMNEWGLPSITSPVVTDWVRRYFTRENAAIWFAGPEPADLPPLQLAHGVPQPLIPMRDVLPHYPAYFRQGTRTIGWQAVVKRSTAAVVFSDVLKRQLFRDLRQDAGYSYTIDTNYDTQDAATAAITCLADADSDSLAPALGAFVDVLAQMRYGSISEDDIASSLNQCKQTVNHPDYDALSLPGDCADLVIGVPPVDHDQYIRELDAIDAAALRQVAEEAASSMLMCVPSGSRAEWAGYEPAPLSLDEPVVGQQFSMVDGHADKLTISHDGVTIQAGQDTFRTARFVHCAGMLAWPDGARALVAEDGTVVSVEPTLWIMDPQAMAQIDRAIPREKIVWQPARQPDQIPRPEPATPSPSPAPAVHTTTIPTPLGAVTRTTAVAPQATGWKVATGILTVMSSLWILLTIFGFVTSDDAGPGFIFFGIPLWAATAGVIVGLRTRIRKQPAEIPQPKPAAEDPMAKVSTADLRKRSAAALVSLDAAMKNGVQELEYARAEFGLDATAPFSRALDTAKQDATSAFATQEQLNTTAPKADQQRAMLIDILNRCARASHVLDDQTASFANLRDQQNNVGPMLDEADQHAKELELRLPVAQQTLATLAATHPAGALRTVDDVPAQVAALLSAAQEAITKGRAALVDGNKYQALGFARVARNAVEQSTALLDTVDAAANSRPA